MRAMSIHSAAIAKTMPSKMAMVMAVVKNWRERGRKRRAGDFQATKTFSWGLGEVSSAIGYNDSILEELSNGGSPVLKTGVRKDMWVRIPLPPHEAGIFGRGIGL